MLIDKPASTISVCSSARKVRPTSGSNPINEGIAAQCTAQVNEAAAPSRSRRVPADVASDLLNAFFSSFQFVALECYDSQSIDSWLAVLLLFNGRAAELNRWRIMTDEQ